MTKILVLSDLNWHSYSKKIGPTDIVYLKESKKVSSGEKFYSVHKYWKIIVSEKPDIVLLAGDLTGDGSCGHGYHWGLSYLLSLLELAGITTCFIKGDNDLADDYNLVIERFSSSPHIYEISKKIIKIDGIRICGLPYSISNNKKKLNKAIAQLQEHPIDMLIGHSPLKRRTHLIDKIDAKTIITGHFDNKLCLVNNKNYISLSNDSEVINYLTIEDITSTNTITKSRTQNFEYHFYNPTKKLDIKYRTQGMGTEKSIGQLYLNEIPTSISQYEDMDLPYSYYEKEKNALALALKYLRGQDYKVALEWLLSKKELSKVDRNVLNTMMSKRVTSNHTLSKTMIADYLGPEVWPILQKGGE